MRLAHFSATRWLLGGIGLLLATACTDPYLPEAVQNPPSYLVVDGFLNPQGVTTIKLSRTYAIGAKTAPPVETKATAYLEEENGPRTLLREASAGTYTSPALILNPAKRFRLHLNTLAGLEYVSDFVPVKNTPAIDKLTWNVDNNGVNIYLNTHDATNATQYYRWDYVETWEIIPIYHPTTEYVNRTIGMRPITMPLPTICWGNALSSQIQIDKTTALSQDVVANFPLRKIANTSERLYQRYSILAEQYALTKEEYAYWELLRKNTESIGSLFDPQPSQLTGNVHCLTRATELVLGYVGAHSVTEKRLFIARQDLPSNFPFVSGYERCIPPDTIFLKPKSSLPPPPPADILQTAFSGPNALIPIDPVYLPNMGLSGYTAKDKDCVDCRARGSSAKPSYWP